MNVLKAVWYGAWNPWFLVHTYEVRQHEDGPKKETDPLHWKLRYTHENGAPMMFITMGVLATLLWLPYWLLLVLRFFSYTAWLNKAHPFIVALTYNKSVVDAKQYTYDGGC